MTNDTNGPSDGRGTLRDRLPRIESPRELDDRVRATVATRGLVRPPRRSGARWVVRASLIAAGFVVGILAASLWRGGAALPRSTATPRYVLLLYDDARGDTGAVHVAREREYGRWASSLEGARWVGGDELGDLITGIGPAGSVAVPLEDRLAGYFVIEAQSAERAAQVARSCPHVKYGGRVVVMSVAS